MLLLKSLEKDLRSFVLGIHGSEDTYFQRLTESIAAWLQADVVIIGEKGVHMRIEPYAVFSQEATINVTGFDVTGTPCGDVLSGKNVIIPSQAMNNNPSSSILSKLQAEGYIGIPLNDQDGKTFGLIAVIKKDKLILPPSCLDVFDLLAAQVVSFVQKRKSAIMLETFYRSIVGYSGREFFINLVNRMYDFFEVSCVFVSEFVNDYEAHTQGMVLDGKFLENVTYPIDGSPCGDLRNNEVLQIVDDICSRYPDDALLRELGARGYFGYPLKDRNGVVMGVVACISKTPLELADYAAPAMSLISQRAAVELERQRIDRILSFMKLGVDNAADVIMFVRQDGSFAYVNDAASRKLGYSQEDFSGLHLFDIDTYFSSEDWVVAWNNMKNTRQGVFETIFRHRDGNLVPVEITATMNNFRGEEYMFIDARDISVRKRMERLLLEEKEKAQYYLDIANIIFILIDPHGIVQIINKKGSDLLGYPMYEIVGKNWFDNFLPDYNRQQVRAHIAEMFLGFIEEDDIYENTVITRDGSERHIEWRVAYLRNDQGNITSILASGEDVTERRLRDAQLRQSQKLAAMGEMIGAIAHQWRQPLNALSMYISTLKTAQRNGRLTEQFIHDLVNGAGNQIQFMSKTIDDFRNYYRPSREKEEIVITDAVRSAVDMLVPQLKHHNIDIVINYSEGADTASVFGHRSEFVHVLVNLVANARDAIEARAETVNNFRGTIALHVAQHDTHIMLSVKDNGIGIPDQVIEKIFDPYFTTKGEKSGTGIGLYMARMIVDDMQGTITAENTGDGTLFLVQLPLPRK